MDAAMPSRSSFPGTFPGQPGALSIARWLFCVAALVVAMVVVGGITRLTESGLSITEWKPVTGALPRRRNLGSSWCRSWCWTI